MYNKTFLLTLFLVGSLSLSRFCSAETCPTELKQDNQGHWYSDEKPGWKSTKPTAKNISLNSNEFAGVMYSPTQERVACVYKASNKEWVALVSELYGVVKIDKTVKDDAGSSTAWEYSDKYKDYICGAPSVKSIYKCSFTFELEKTH